MEENPLSKIIVNAAFHIHKEFGPGLFESVYEQILYHELINSGLIIKRQQAIPVIWNGLKMEQGFRADLIVNDKVLIEIKSVEQIARVHQMQVLTYLKLSNLKLGLLINFNVDLIKNGIQRIVNKL
ncbi:GxxExxY protein [Crocinitomix catalasitica]|nr:GxxExxY protein [Crocinitomix catalasitica]